MFLGEVVKQTDRLIIDLSRVSFMDSHGLDVLRELQAWARASEGHLRLAAPPPVVCRLLALTGDCYQLASFPTVEAAATARSAALVDPTP